MPHACLAAIFDIVAGFDRARLRLTNQRLWGAPLPTPEQVVGWLGAVQAQDYAGAKWAVAQRARRCGDAELDRALAEGTILRTHVMRPTWHFVLPADIRWMLDLTAARVRARMAPYDRQLELDAAVYRRSDGVLAAALRDGRHLSREELARKLAEAGIVARGMRLAHLLMHAELQGLVCSGPRRGRQFTYALLDERAAPAAPRPRDESLAELALRFFRSHGPATARDFAAWSGLTVADSRRAAEAAGLAREEADGKVYWLAPPLPASRGRTPAVLLLPNYDEYLVAYRDREPPDPALLAATIRPDALLAAHTIVLKGRLAGGWRRALTEGAVDIEAKLAVPLGASGARALQSAAKRYAAFCGRGTKVTLRCLAAGRSRR